tara:strand:+ start:7055 stop:7315 length:261 start_codon:yes stop_codon:yes gene_type:complete
LTIEVKTVLIEATPEATPEVTPEVAEAGVLGEVAAAAGGTARTAISAGSHQVRVEAEGEAEEAGAASTSAAMAAAAVDGGTATIAG